MVSIQSFAAEGIQTDGVLQELAQQIKEPKNKASFIFVFYSCQHNPKKIRSFLCHYFPQAKAIGGTSHTGLMTEAGLFGPHAIGILAISDPDGLYGAALARVESLDNVTSGLGEAGLRRALADTGNPGELPGMIWVCQTPGTETASLTGIRNQIGDRCPVVGGSVADNDGTGAWQLFCRDAVSDEKPAIAVAALNPSAPTGTAFEYGYAPTGHSGIITKAEGQRICEIDDEPAQQVYHSWVSRQPSPAPEASATICHPLGIRVGETPGLSEYLLVFPVLRDDGIQLYTMSDAPVNHRIHFMSASARHIAERADRVCHQAITQIPEKNTLAGGITFCCAAYLSMAADARNRIFNSVRSRFGDHPFLTVFTYGEIGSVSGHNQYDSLMMSAAAFAA